MPKPFAIVAAPRTGTNLIAHALAAMQPRILCFNEVFNNKVPPISGDARLWGHPIDFVSHACPSLWAYACSEQVDRRFETPSDFLSLLYGSPVDKEVQCIGLKILYDQLNQMANSTELFTTVAARSVKIIHLKRRNLLAQYYSLKIAERTGTWVWGEHGQYDPPDDQLKIRIWVPDLLIYFGKLLQQEKVVNKMAGGCICMDVWYEDIMQDVAGALARIAQFIGYDGAPIEPKTRRQNTRSLSDVIENFDEIKAIIEHTMIVERFGEYFDLANIRQRSSELKAGELVEQWAVTTRRGRGTDAD